MITLCFNLCSCLFDLYFKDFTGCAIVIGEGALKMYINTYCNFSLENTVNFKNEKEMLQVTVFGETSQSAYRRSGLGNMRVMSVKVVKAKC